MDSNNFQENNQNNVNVQQLNPYGNVPPVYTQPIPQKAPVNGMAIGGLVCGIISILMCCCCGIGVVVAIVGVILSLLSKKSSGGKLSGVAIAGLICSVIGLLFGVVGCIFLFSGSIDLTYELKRIMDDLYYYY